MNSSVANFGGTLLFVSRFTISFAARFWNRRARRLPPGAPTTNETSEFLASSDNWFRPVEVRTGPEGALWIVDMYRFVIEHPRWIPAERLATLDVRAGASQGRIWRVFPTGKRRPAIRNMDNLTSAELALAVGGANGVERELAHRLLLERSTLQGTQATIATEVKRIAVSAGTTGGRVQALALLDQLDALTDEIVGSALRDDDPRVRRFAVRLCEPRKSRSTTATPFATAERVAPLVDDPDGRVRYQLALTLGEFSDETAQMPLRSWRCGMARMNGIAPLS
jgi:hypothetical protein